MDMVVLSLFDGIGCAKVALDNMRVKHTYYSSEIDKYCIDVLNYNYKDVIHVGDIKNIDTPFEVDLLIGGSPCQGFSVAGKQLLFDDPNSRLFYEYVRVLELVKPKYFIYENVVMPSDITEIISSTIGVNPIVIDAKDYSAQSRKRNFWTNVTTSVVSKSSDMVIKDIMNPYNGQYLSLNDFPIVKERSNYYQYSLNDKNYLSAWSRIYKVDKKHPTITRANRGTYVADGDKVRKLSPNEIESLQGLPQGYICPNFSNSRIIQMVANGFSVPVIEELLSHII
jgi:DNA (cytosine-5)-methyltransferase 3A